ncbi:hypothetical protein SAMN05443572_102609 [Myxococcus fulvus]|uniref:Uncharacterized protein n=1 Tax=Myxococcus fulvus TaxID=33 RepID=A0A511SWJ1_MYXFU|nr:molybdopterin-synthase adenylyltransferase MoeB [Myxococcus fulvus]AKF86837.1 hypothetical protein MFUL124B02_34310 [Myxococcus fulvus 124B02]GEN06280.1 hypothetical protein MFU01_13170 [Myxococcus fulvus]SET53414.1 hypothetical protein SAMN05443572_102609 [Myxococcus fulvus]
MGLKQAIEKLNTAVDDLVTLEVITYTGDVKHIINTTGGKPTIDWDNLTTSSVGSATTQATIKLVAATQVKFDGDMKLFQTDQQDIPRLQELLDLHRKSVETSIAARKSVVDFFGDLLKDIVKKG